MTEANANAPAPQPLPPQVVIQQTDRRSSRWFSWLGWVGLLVCAPIVLGMVAAYREYFDTTNGIQEHFHSRDRAGLNKIAIIEISGD